MIHVSDLKLIDGEPRVADRKVQEVLEFGEIKALRRLIKRHEDELLTYGEIIQQVEDAVVSGGLHQIDAKPTDADGIKGQIDPKILTERGRGRPVVTYMLTEPQALLVCMKANTPKAADGRREIIRVFMAYRRGELLPTGRAAGGQGASSVLFDESSVGEKKVALEMVRLAIVLRGKAAGDYIWHQCPCLEPLPDNTAPEGGTTEAEGRAALCCIVEAVGEQLRDWRIGDFADKEEINRDLAAMGLRCREDALQVAHREVTAFDGTRWARGSHKAALLALPQVTRGETPTYFKGRPSRYLILPWSLIDEEAGDGNE